jgi:hypothetical protein
MTAASSTASEFGHTASKVSDTLPLWRKAIKVWTRSVRGFITTDLNRVAG